MINIIYLAIGLALVVKGADFLIDGASSIAKKYNISDLVVGLTIIAFGTSLPEMAVSIVAGIEGKGEITLGNIIGSNISNISNILLILGATSLVSDLKVKVNTIWKEIPFSFLGVLVLIVLASDVSLTGLSHSSISRADGLILLSFFSIYLYYTFGVANIGGESTSAVKK
ncbi:MAG: hypothetical protein Q9M91_01600 [Candidatus Dojkabacteria bacterium]|nr:hypothetical protein [Candidatus Dojkabacteria bacterium]